MQAVDPNLICIGCSHSFRNSSGRINHQQSVKKCCWVYDLQSDTAPAPTCNYLADPGEDEEDPPAIEEGDIHVTDDPEVFAIFDDDPHPPPSSSAPASPRATIPSTFNLFHDLFRRAHVEDELDAEPAETNKYTSAGKVFRFDLDAQSSYLASSTPPENTYHPFASHIDWDVAKWAKEEGIAQNAFTRLLAIPRVCEKLGLSYHDSRSLNQTIEELPASTAWHSVPVSVEHANGTISADFFFREALDCVKTIYSNPAFVDYMSFTPEQQFSDTTKQQHLYNEMHTGDWWWSTQAKLLDGVTIAPIILSSDKTQLTVFNNDQTAYPIYLTIGNIARSIHCKPSLHAQILIGYLPTPKLSGLSEEAACTVCAHLFHAAMTVIMESLQAAGKDGVEMKSGNGAVRRCHPILACYVADYPEQSLVACTHFGSCCPKCKAVEIEFELNGIDWTPQRQAEMLRSLHHAAQQPLITRQEAVLKEVGLTHVIEPFWEHLMHCNIHSAITPNILHQLYQGLIQYLIIWVTSIIGTSELDACFKRLPKTHGIRSFTDGISCLSKVSAGERREICKQLLGCIIGKALPGAIHATHALLDFLHIAAYESHSEETLGYLQSALNEFHNDKKIFLDLEARGHGHFNLPKLHSLQHYVDSIRALGCTNNYNTEATEWLHIDYAKDAYRTMNKKDYLTQMIWWLDQRERVTLFEVHVRWHQGTLPTLHLPRRSRAGLTLAKRPNYRAVAFPCLVQNYHAQHFSCALQDFVCKYNDPMSHQQDNIVIPFHTVKVWDRVKFQLKNLQDDDGPDFQDTAIAMLIQGNKSSRFDTVLVAVGETEETGVDGLRVRHLRVIFRLPQELNITLFPSPQVTAPSHLAYIEWYSQFTTTRPNHCMYQVTKTANWIADVSIVEVSDIRRSCQLIPDFGVRVDRAWTAENVLDRCKSFFVNNFVDKHTYQSIW